MQSNNLAYQWNDVALLTDQRAYTFVCKTMLQIPEDEVEDLQEIVLADWQNKSAQEDTFDGAMQLQIAYLNQQKECAALQVEVPLQGELSEPLESDANARLIYSKGKLAGSCLLLETVLQIPRFQPLQRSQVIVGPFEMEELLELPESWPDCRNVEATVSAVVIDSCQVRQQQLYLEGRYQLAVVYESDDQPGEQLYAYEQQRPMQLALPVPAGLQELERTVPYYHNITAQLLDERRIMLAGAGVFCTEAVQDDMVEESQESVNSAKQAQMRTEPASEENEVPTENHLCMDDVLPQTPCATPRSVQTPQKPQLSHPSVVNSRGSRRANLSKYMRNLNSSVQSPSITRNIEIGVELEQTEEE